MLYSLFFVDDNRYIIAINQISEVVPFVYLKTIPALPDYAAGLLDYHGESVPVIDLCHLLSNRPCNRKLSTRIILVAITVKDRGKRLLGFLVERATETFAVNSDKFVVPGLHNVDLSFIGPVVSDECGVITKIFPQNIFGTIDETLFYPNELSVTEII